MSPAHASFSMAAMRAGLCTPWLAIQASARATRAAPSSPPRVPPSDFLDEQSPYLGGLIPEDHPNYYEESVSPGPSAALLYCDLARALLGASDDCMGVPRQ